MSVRAYKIIQTADEPSFNLWNDEIIMNLIESVVGLGLLGNEAVGMLSIDNEQLDEMKEVFEKEKSKYTKGEIKETEEVFEKIKNDFDESGYVSYSCW